MPRYRVRIAGKHYDTMADLVRKHRLNIAGHTGKKAGRSRYIVDAFADSDQIEQLKSEGYSVDVREDVDEAGKKRQSEIRSLTTREPARNVGQISCKTSCEAHEFSTGVWLIHNRAPFFLLEHYSSGSLTYPSLL